MICYVFKPRRRVKGVLAIAKHFSGKLRMPWETKVAVIALQTSDRRIAERALNEAAKERHLERQGYPSARKTEETAQKPLNELLDTFIADTAARGRAENTLIKYKRLKTQFVSHGWHRLGDVTPGSFCDWRAQSHLMPKTKNDALLNASAFFNWLKKQRIIRENPLEGVQRVDNRRTPQFRRALTPDEAQRLLAASPHTRAAIYLILMETGLRRSELNQLTWSDFTLDGPAPCVRVRASIAKTPELRALPIRAEVIKAIRSVAPDMPMPFEFIFRSKLPRVPTMQKDLARAGIPFKDEQGRRIDLHALRDTFCTNLSTAGVFPRVAMELMRHRDIRQTMKTYTDAAQLPLAAAIQGLPNLSI